METEKDNNTEETQASTIDECNEDDCNEDECNDDYRNECGCYYDKYNNDDNYSEYIKRKSFYIMYRFKQRCSGILWGVLDGSITGMCLAGKWGGAGGWIAGGITQGVGLVLGPIVFGGIGIIHGALSDRKVVSGLMKDYRYSIGSGGIPPTHGMVS